MRSFKYAIIVFNTVILMTVSICHAQFGKHGLNWGSVVETVGIDSISRRIAYGLESLTVRLPDYSTVKKDTIPQLFVVSSIGLDCFRWESKSGAYKVGLMPGVGYGIKYKPHYWKVTPYLLALDLFIDGSLSDDIASHESFDYFNIDGLFVLTFIDWVGVGFGPRIKIGLDHVPLEFRLIFAFGMRKATE